MNDETNIHAGIEGESLGVSRTLDVLIARIVDNHADEHDWATFAALATNAPPADNAWQRLAECQRDAAVLSARVQVLTAPACRVGLPVGGSRIHERHGEGRRAPALPRFAGWGIAAALALAWVGTSLNLVPRQQDAGGTRPITAGWPISTSDDAVKAYLDVGGKSGRVLGEMPGQVILSAGPSATQGKVEVIYLRQFVERATVDSLGGLGADEGGRIVPAPVSAPLIYRIEN